MKQKTYTENSTSTTKAIPNNAKTAANPKSSKPVAETSKRSPSYIQDNILKHVIAEQSPVTIILMNGFQMPGKVVSFDQYVIIFKTSNGNNNMIFKHAISTIVY